MPVRRLNYTDRQRIAQADVEFILHVATDGTGAFDARLDLSRYEFPSDARVFVEAYRQTTLMRFDYGSVSTPVPPANRALADFETADEVRFRVKVTATAGDAGKLLGEADRIRPRLPDEQPDRRIPLLPPVPEDLGEEIWRVEFDGNTTWLKVNSGLPDWKEAVRSHTFRALVYPAAMRQILERILLVDNVTVIDDPSDWHSRWLNFASTLPGSRTVPGARDEFDEWIENAVSAFARRYAMRKRFVASME